MQSARNSMLWKKAGEKKIAHNHEHRMTNQIRTDVNLRRSHRSPIRAGNVPPYGINTNRRKILRPPSHASYCMHSYFAQKTTEG